MKTGLRWGMASAAMLAIIVLMGGCPKPPVFNTSGDYEGSMSAWVTKSDCAMKMSLVQEPALPFPLNHDVIGFVKFDWACITDLSVVAGFMDSMPELVLPVTGYLSAETPGRLFLTIDSALLDLPFAAAFECTGTGKDEDGDGNMDSLTGEYSLKLTIKSDAAAQQEIPIEITDAFEVSTTVAQ